MIINIAKKDVSSFIELMYLGNWLVNSNFTMDKMVTKYEKLFNKVFKSVEETLTFEYEELYDRVEKFIQKYNSDILPSEIAKQYADLKQPIDKSRDKVMDSYEKNRALREEIEQEIKQRGLKNFIFINEV